MWRFEIDPDERVVRLRRPDGEPQWECPVNSVTDEDIWSVFQEATDRVIDLMDFADLQSDDRIVPAETSPFAGRSRR